MKVLLIRFSSIGDIVITSPIIRCLKTQLKEVELHFLTKENFSNLVVHNPYISKVHKLKSNGLTPLIEHLKKEQFDCVIDLHKNIRTQKIKRQLKTKWFSYQKLNFKKWLFVHFKLDLLPHKHLVDRYFEGIKTLNIVNDNLGLEYHLPTKTQIDLPSFSLIEKQYYVISLGATYFTKRIPNHTLQSLIKRLNNSPVVLIGAGESDIKKAEYLTQTTQHQKVINLCNKLSIDESAYIIKHAHTVITGDTGMMHIAACFDVNIEAFWGNTHPKFGMYAYETQKVKNHVVNIPCHPCSKLGSNSCPRGHFDCMNKHDILKIKIG